MQAALAINIIRALVPSGVTTSQAMAALAANKAFTGLAQTTLRFYVRRAFYALRDEGFTLSRVKGENYLKDSLRDRIIFEANEMRKGLSSRKEIIQILSEDFGVTKKQVEAYIKGGN